MVPRRILCVLLLLAALGSRSAAAADQWVEINSPHFILLTNAGEKEGRHLLDQFERMRWVFQQLFPQANVDPAVPIVVVAAKDDKTFAAMEPAAYLARGAMKLGGYFLHSTDRNYILLDLDVEPEQHPFATVYHEYTHVEFASAGGWMPLWLNEGTAEFFQNTEISGKNVQLGQPSTDNILYLREHQLVPLKVLFAVDTNSPYYHEEQKGSVFYAESWALTHYLMMTDRLQHTDKVDQYVALVHNHEDPVAAGEKAFGDLKQLEKALDSYIQQASYKELVLNSAAAPIDESAFKTKALSQTDVDAVRADVLASVQRTDEARALAESVLKADSNNVQARETMGFLEFRAGHPEEALKWYGEAVKLGSQDFLAYYYFAQFSMVRGGVDQTGGDDAIESSLRTAIKLNPRFAPSYDRLAAYYARNHENLDEAHRLDLQAVELDPDNVYYRLNTSNVLMEMGRYDDAVAVLKYALQTVRNQSQIAIVESRIDQVERVKAVRTQPEEAYTQPQAAVQTTEKIVVVNTAPQHPTESSAGPKKIAVGVIRGVTCSYPSVVELRVVTAPGKSLDLYNNDLAKIDLTAVAGLSAPSSMNPCKDFEGRTVRVQYVQSSDQTVDGQVTAIELRK